MEQFVEFRDGTANLAGVLHLPANLEGPLPVVIYCPGKNGERYEVHRLAVKLARRLEEQGIAMLRFDYEGQGLSDGHYYDMTTSSKLSNVQKAWEYIGSRKELDCERVAFLGFSDGARIALMSANAIGMKNVVLWSPLFYEFGGNYPSGKHPRFRRHKRKQEKLVMPWAGLWISMDFYRDLQMHNVQAELTGYDGESLILYGNDDPLIKEEWEQMEDQDRGALFKDDDRNQVVSIDGAGHLFTSEVFEDKVMQLTIGWLKKKWLTSDQLV